MVKYQTLKDRLDPGGEEDNYEKTIKVDGVILAAGAWCEYLGSLVGVNIPVCNTYLVKFDSVIIRNYNFIIQQLFSFNFAEVILHR